MFTEVVFINSPYLSLIWTFLHKNKCRKFSPAQPRFMGEILTPIVAEIKYRWFELFVNLQLDRSEFWAHCFDGRGMSDLSRKLIASPTHTTVCQQFLPQSVSRLSSHIIFITASVFNWTARMRAPCFASSMLGESLAYRFRLQAMPSTVPSIW